MTSRLGKEINVNFFLQWRHLDIFLLIVICDGVQASMRFTFCATTRTYRAVPSWPRYSLRRVQTSLCLLLCSGSVWDWRIQILPSTSKIDKINYRYDFYCFWLLNDMVSWRLMQSKCINSKKKAKKLFKKDICCCHLESIAKKNRIRIRIKMSRIRNTSWHRDDIIFVENTKSGFGLESWNYNINKVLAL